MEINVTFKDIKKYLLIIICISPLLFVVLFGAKIFEANEYGNYQIKQSAGSGKITVINTSGLYMQNFGKVHDYRVSDENYFSKLESDGGSGQEADPIIVRFNDGSQAEVSGMIKYRLSLNEELQKKLHRDFKSYESVKSNMIRQVVSEALMQTAKLMRAEESYDSRSVEFTAIAEGQVREGIYDTVTKEVEVIGDDGTRFLKKVVEIKKDEKENPIVKKNSSFKEYGVEIIQFVIKEIDYDERTDSLIAKRKEADQKRLIARTDAETAKQETITVGEQTKAKVALAEGEALIEKKTAVINAQKEREVAEENTKKAFAEAKSTRATGQAEAFANQLKKRAGLTPQEEAEWKYKTAVGREEARAKFQPAPNAKIVIMGSNGNGGAINPFDAMSLNAMKEYIKD